MQASARNSCGYIVRLQESEFLLQGGDPEWLQGITHTPLKLQNFYDLIKFVAHQPWLITKEHIEVRPLDYLVWFGKLKGLFCDPNMLFLCHNSVHTHKIRTINFCREKWGDEAVDHKM